VAAEQIWLRYLPGVVAALGSAAMIVQSSERSRITSTVGATLLGLVCMEGEYWVADGFPTSDMAFFACAVAITLAALAVGNMAPMALGFIGLLFFAYVNLRYGAPYLLDYVMPLLYAILAAISRRSLKWPGHGILKVGWPEALAVVALEALAAWRTTELDKWGWIAGQHWH
jgi:hypothetical protein